MMTVRWRKRAYRCISVRLRCVTVNPMLASVLSLYGNSTDRGEVNTPPPSGKLVLHVLYAFLVWYPPPLK